MGLHKIQMPDVGEGITEAEIVEWNVKVGDVVREDDVLAAVMTDKATVEIPSPVDGTVQAISGDVGESVAVGTVIIVLEVQGEGNAAQIADTPPEPAPEQTSEPAPEPEAVEANQDASPKANPAPTAKKTAAVVKPVVTGKVVTGAPRAEGEKPVASPAVRKRARSAGVKLEYVHGSGPGGRITHDDLDAYISGASAPVGGPASRAPNTSVEEIKVIGLRRKIAERMQDAKSRIPHITYVEEVDVTEVENLREHLNANRKEGQPKLTILPFIMKAVVTALKDYPKLSSHYDDGNDVLYQYGAAHIGMAAQTPGGLMVPVIKHGETYDIWGLATESKRLADAARDGSITRDELTGSTITISSLGRMGGIVSTPVINSPEVAIVGVNKVSTQPVFKDGGFVPRQIMNLSSSFDHRIVDGWDAAEFIQRVRGLLETPATLFMEG